MHCICQLIDYLCQNIVNGETNMKNANKLLILSVVNRFFDCLLCDHTAFDNFADEKSLINSGADDLLKRGSARIPTMSAADNF